MGAVIHSEADRQNLAHARIEEIGAAFAGTEDNVMAWISPGGSAMTGFTTSTNNALTLIAKHTPDYAKLADR